jgi:hypothetical protein
LRPMLMKPGPSLWERQRVNVADFNAGTSVTLIALYSEVITGPIFLLAIFPSEWLMTFPYSPSLHPTFQSSEPSPAFR